MNLEESVATVEGMLGRPLTPDEAAAVERLHRAGRDLQFIVDTIVDPDPVPQAADEELPTVRYEPSGDDARRIP